MFYLGVARKGVERCFLILDVSVDNITLSQATLCPKARGPVTESASYFK
jgi:hypothetical protein